ncbi:MAG TPA: hypothetical protein VN793_04745 [Acidimicrobiales bacterium]|nr:hypothetical protein [Acidimicrobiales bacterium]
MEDGTSLIEPEMWDTPIETGEARDASVPGPEELRELDLRLREQAAENAKLDAELRYLLEELSIRKEFITHLEEEVESARSLDGRHRQTVAEFAAYRQRLSHRAVDHLVMQVHRIPWLYRGLRALSRAGLALASRPAARTLHSSRADRPTSDGRGAGPTSADPRRSP